MTGFGGPHAQPGAHAAAGGSGGGVVDAGEEDEEKAEAGAAPRLDGAPGTALPRQDRGQSDEEPVAAMAQRVPQRQQQVTAVPPAAAHQPQQPPQQQQPQQSLPVWARPGPAAVNPRVAAAARVDDEAVAAAVHGVLKRRFFHRGARPVLGGGCLNVDLYDLQLHPPPGSRRLAALAVLRGRDAAADDDEFRRVPPASPAARALVGKGGDAAAAPFFRWLDQRRRARPNGATPSVSGWLDGRGARAASAAAAHLSAGGSPLRHFRLDFEVGLDDDDDVAHVDALADAVRDADGLESLKVTLRRNTRPRPGETAQQARERAVGGDAGAEDGLPAAVLRLAGAAARSRTVRELVLGTGGLGIVPAGWGAALGRALALSTPRDEGGLRFLLLFGVQTARAGAGEAAGLLEGTEPVRPESLWGVHEGARRHSLEVLSFSSWRMGDDEAALLVRAFLGAHNDTLRRLELDGPRAVPQRPPAERDEQWHAARPTPPLLAALLEVLPRDRTLLRLSAQLWSNGFVRYAELEALAEVFVEGGNTTLERLHAVWPQPLSALPPATRAALAAALGAGACAAADARLAAVHELLHGRLTRNVQLNAVRRLVRSGWLALGVRGAALVEAAGVTEAHGGARLAEREVRLAEAGLTHPPELPADLAGLVLAYAGATGKLDKSSGEGLQLRHAVHYNAPGTFKVHV